MKYVFVPPGVLTKWKYCSFGGRFPVHSPKPINQKPLHPSSSEVGVASKQAAAGSDAQISTPKLHLQFAKAKEPGAEEPNSYPLISETKTHKKTTGSRGSQPFVRDPCFLQRGSLKLSNCQRKVLLFPPGLRMTHPPTSPEFKGANKLKLLAGLGSVIWRVQKGTGEILAKRALLIFPCQREIAKGCNTKTPPFFGQPLFDYATGENYAVLFFDSTKNNLSVSGR